jgi:hypothetical protein
MSNEIIDALAPHLHSEHIEALTNDEIWVQVADKWAKVERIDPRACSYVVTTGYEAGSDLAGGERIEPKVTRVNGLRFGVIPRVLRWVDYNGTARPAKH